MDLRHYLFEKDMTLAQFARECGITQQHASLIKKKKRYQPRIDTLIKIMRYTKGAITPSDLLPEIFEEYKKIIEKKDETN